MAKGGKGATCPSCNKQTFHDKGSFRECSGCGCVGWGWHQQVSGVGKGKGNKCPNCENQTLHKVHTKNSVDMYRCGTCDYSMVEFPADSGN